MSKARAVETHAEILKTACVVDEASEPDSDELDALISVFQAEEDAADARELAKGKDELVAKVSGKQESLCAGACSFKSCSGA